MERADEGEVVDVAATLSIYGDSSRPASETADIS